MKTPRSPSRWLALISAGIILLAPWPERQLAVSATFFSDRPGESCLLKERRPPSP